MRKQGWESEFVNYMVESSEREFKWGELDCLIFASDCALMMCDKDPMSKAKAKDPDTIRGMYDNKEDAYKLIYEYRKSIPDVMDVHFDRINPNFAQRGDIVLAKIGNFKTFGLVSQGHAFFKMENKGLHREKISHKMIAWRVE